MSAHPERLPPGQSFWAICVLDLVCLALLVGTAWGVVSIISFVVGP